MGRKRIKKARAYSPEARDAAMARVAAARACAKNVLDGCDEILALFVEPDEDDDRSERDDLLELAIEAAGMVSRALEAAQVEMPSVDPEECEPWDEDSDDDEEDKDEDGE